MRHSLTAMTLLALTASTLLAQGGRGGGRMGRPLGPPPDGDSAPPNRALLERQIRQRLGQRVRTELGLSDDQMKKLQETNRRFDERRRALVDQERDVRMSLRDEMIRGDSGRQSQVGSLLERNLKVQRQRVDLIEQEQAELGKFLTPMQRARYFSIEERMRLQMQQMRQQQMGGRNGRGGPPMDDGQPSPMQPGMQGRARGRGGPPMDPPPDGQLPPLRQRRRPPPDSGAFPPATPDPRL